MFLINGIGKVTSAGFALLLSVYWGVGASSAHAVTPQESPSLRGHLGERGELALPPGFRGTLDPTGYKIASVEGEPLLFIPDDAKTGQGDDPWSGAGTVGNGCNGDVRALALDGAGRVYVGGSFTQCGDVAARFVAVFDSLTNTWNSLGTGAANGVDLASSSLKGVYDLAMVGDDLYVAGSFNRAGGAAANSVARFNTTAQTWASLGSGLANGVNGLVEALAVDGSDIYVAGQFTRAGGATANYVARFNTVSQSWFPMGSGAANGVDRAINDVAVIGSHVYVGGLFTLAGGAPANRVARFDSTTQTWSSLGSGAANGVDAGVLALATDGSDLYVGGAFSLAGGGSANGVARFNTTSLTWASLGQGAANGTTNVVGDLAIANGDVFAGGRFFAAGGVAANRVARFNMATQSWSSLGSGMANGVNHEVFALAAAGGEVYIGGLFTQAGASAASYVARFSTTGGMWAPLGNGSASGLNGTVFALAIAGSDVYVGGDFTQAGGGAANNVARFNTTTRTWSPLGVGPANGVSSPVSAIVVDGNDIYVGGSFSQAGGAAANYVARFNSTTQSWSALGSGGANGVNSGVLALAVADGDVYVGGTFSRAGGVTANRVAGFDPSTQTWFTLGVGAANGVNGQVSALAIEDRNVYVGGLFTQAGGVAANFVARFNLTDRTWSPLASGAANGLDGGVFALTIMGSKVYAGGFFTQAGGVPANSVAGFDTRTQNWFSLGSGPANGVNNTALGLAIVGNDLFAGGLFTEAGGTPASYVARFSITEQRWSALGSGLHVARAVHELASVADALTVGGEFGQAGITVTSHLARYRVDRIFASGFEGS